MNRRERRLREKENEREKKRSALNEGFGLEIKEPKLMDNCYVCGKPLYSSDKAINIRGRNFCEFEPVSVLVMRWEEAILNDSARSN